MSDPGLGLPSGAAREWRSVYWRQLDQRIDRSLAYLSSAPVAQVRAHIRSFLTLLNETHRFESLNPKAFELITRLHPLPLRWGLGNVWEAELRFALAHIPAEQTGLIADYRCSLGDVYLARGQFEQAIAEDERVLALPGAALTIAARAARSLFTCYRADGRTQREAELLQQVGPRFFGDRPAAEVPLEAAQAWLQFQQCRLILLRERGQLAQALALAEDMLWLDEREGCPSLTLTADLYTDRGTLLWALGRYPKSVTDQQQAMRLFDQAQDQFNAESLKSNLGLTYWSMGQLDLAEQTLLEVIRFYRETGSEQLLTYAISYLGLVYFARGDLEPALRLNQEHIELAERIHFIHEVYRGRRNLGEVLYYFGEYERAIAETNAAHAYYEKRGSRDGYGQDLLWLALCYHALGQPEKAQALAHQILDWSREMNLPILEQLSLRCLAAVQSERARAERERLLLRSLELAQATGRAQEEAAVYIALSGVFTGSQRAEAWRKGEAILRQIGAEQWLAGKSPQDAPVLPLLL